VINEHGGPLDLDLNIACLRDGQQTVVSGRLELSIAARSKEKIACTGLFGAFFDTTYAFRFGPPSHDVTVARLYSRATGGLIAEAYHFPLGRTKAFHTAEIDAMLVQVENEWFLDLQTDRLAQSIHIDLDGYRAEDDWFHLAPGIVRRLKLFPRPGISAETAPKGQIRALGSRRIFEI
jgi:beta-mannosidase